MVKQSITDVHPDAYGSHALARQRCAGLLADHVLGVPTGEVGSACPVLLMLPRRPDGNAIHQNGKLVPEVCLLARSDRTFLSHLFSLVNLLPAVSALIERLNASCSRRGWNFGERQASCEVLSEYSAIAKMRKSPYKLPFPMHGAAWHRSGGDHNSHRG